jgi:hypothetical protein
MAAREVHVVIDAADVDLLCDFWVAALGYARFGSFEQYRSAMPPAGESGPKLVFQQVPEPRQSAKNRLHLDLVVGDEMEPEADRLVALGARRRSGVVHEAGTAWIVMADPEGNEFCLVHH